MFSSGKIIITVALCGNTSRNESPYVPVTPKEIADSAIEAGRAGASIAHIHVRDPLGNPSSDSKIFAQVVERIQKNSDIVINCTTGGSSYEEKRGVLEINPEIATLNCGSVNLGSRLMMNTGSELEKMSIEMMDRGVKPEMMIHSQGFIENAKKLIDKDIIQPPYYYNLFFASGGMKPSLRTLSYMVDSLPRESIWTTTGSGYDSFSLAVLSMVCAGTARIGLEDCVMLPDGNLAKSNAQLVENLVRIACELGMQIATPEETRKILKI
jgi:3-keto-5-aminohexanoate cleavage enzyme